MFSCAPSRTHLKKYLKVTTLFFLFGPSCPTSELLMQALWCGDLPPELGAQTRPFNLFCQETTVRYLCLYINAPAGFDPPLAESDEFTEWKMDALANQATTAGLPCYLNSDKVFLLLSDRYCNPKRGFEPGSFSGYNCLRVLGHHGRFIYDMISNLNLFHFRISHTKAGPTTLKKVTFWGCQM